MSIYQELHKDHVKVRNLLNELIALSNGHVHDRASALIHRLRDELIPHARAEEAVLYNSLRTIESMHDLISHSYKEHIAAEALLRSLQVRDKTRLDWHKTAKELLTAIEKHVKEEEEVIFEKARHNLSAEEAEQMGRAFMKLKPEIREEGIATNALELAANMMPSRFSKYLRGFSLENRV